MQRFWWKRNRQRWNKAMGGDVREKNGSRVTSWEHAGVKGVGTNGEEVEAWSKPMVGKMEELHMGRISMRDGFVCNPTTHFVYFSRYFW